MWYAMCDGFNFQVDITYNGSELRRVSIKDYLDQVGLRAHMGGAV